MRPILAMLCLPFLLTSCKQLELVGAADICPDETGYSLSEAAACTRSKVIELGSVAAGTELVATSFELATLRHVVALDYSGSMFGRYEGEGDPTSIGCAVVDGKRAYHWRRPEFASLLRRGVLAAMPPTAPAHPLVFNREVLALGQDNEWASRFDLASTSFEGAIPEPISGIDAVVRRLTASGDGTLPIDPYQATFGPVGMPRETRLGQVLDAGAALLDRNEGRGVVWILTDNIIEQSPSENDRAFRDTENNRDFYRRLRSDPRWQIVYAWPIHGQDWLCGGTLLAYGLYYDREASLSDSDLELLTSGARGVLAREDQVEVFSEFGALESELSGTPFKLKPDHLDVVNLRFVGEISCPPRDVGQSRVCEAELEVTNLLNHRRIDGLEIELFNDRLDPFGISRQGDKFQLVRVQTGESMCSHQLRVAKKTLDVGSLTPRSSERLAVDIWVPPVQMAHHTLADRWQSARFSTFSLLGRTRVEIRELRTSLAIPEEHLAKVYGIEDLPQIFRNPNTQDFDAEICLILPVNNPSYLHSLFLLALLVVTALSVVAGGWLLTPSWRVVQLDGVDIGRVRLNRLTWIPISTPSEILAKARLSLGGKALVRSSGFLDVRPRGSYWEVRSRDEFQSSRRLALISKKTPKSSRARDDF